MVEVFNQHVSGTKKHVGVGSIDISSAVPSRNAFHTFVVPLVYKNKDKETLRGTATFTAQIIDNRSALWPSLLSLTTMNTEIRHVLP